MVPEANLVILLSTTFVKHVSPTRPMRTYLSRLMMET